MEPLVSIIVPVYNAQETLRRCADSILAQTCADFELLLIDDGSSDGSPALCDLYASRDSRVIVLHKPNSGVSDTRNLGLQTARGKYLQFVDSDDWVTPEATALLTHAAESTDADLVVADFYRVAGSLVACKRGGIEKKTPMTRMEYAAHMMEAPASFYYGVLWNKLYRRELIMKHELKMQHELSICEDFMFNLEYLRYAQTILAVPRAVYYYVRTKNSLARQRYGMELIKIRLEAFNEYKRFYMEMLDEKEYQKARLKVYRFLVDTARDGFVAPPPLPGTRALGLKDAPSREGAMSQAEMLARTRDFVWQQMAHNDAAHDFDHVARVVSLSRRLARDEGVKDTFLTEMVALLHDIGDAKLPTKEADMIDFLSTLSLDEETRTFIIDVTRLISFRKYPTLPEEAPMEARLVQDADRLDAIGAIGVARTFAYGGAHGIPIAAEPPTRSTLDHFEEKLLRLSALMNTEAGHALAQKRHRFLHMFYTTMLRELEQDRAADKTL